MIRAIPDTWCKTYNYLGRGLFVLVNFNEILLKMAFKDDLIT